MWNVKGEGNVEFIISNKFTKRSLGEGAGAEQNRSPESSPHELMLHLKTVFKNYEYRVQSGRTWSACYETD